jgi:chemotaxis methyl-accepting protein methylase
MGMSFRKLNLIEPLTAEGTFDVIFCRNVLIYQSVENKQQVIRRLAEKLSPKGFLLLGAEYRKASLCSGRSRFRPLQYMPSEALTSGLDFINLAL